MTKTEYGGDARAILSSGVCDLSRAVKVTLGPSGRNVLIKKSKDEDAFSTKDGVTVANSYFSKDSIKQLAIEVIQKVASETDGTAGDGTTTATVIAEYILKMGLNFPSRLNLLDIKKGIDLCTKEVIDILIERAVDCKDEVSLHKVAMISSNYDQIISDAVINAFKISGKQGIVNIKRSRDSRTFVSSMKGMNLPGGYRSRDYMNNYEDEVCEFENAFVYMTNKKIQMVTPNLEYLLNYVAEENKQLLIICKDMDILVSNMLIQQKRKGAIQVCVCRSPGFGLEQEELLRDIGVALGKDPFIENEAIDFDTLSQSELLEYIPTSPAILVTAQNLSIKSNDSQEEAMEGRADVLREQINTKHNAYEKSQLQARISRLTDGIAFIHIGANTDIEFVEKQHRIQDALYAVKSANQEGVVPGGGSALFTISNEINKPENKSLAYGYEIIIQAIRMPLIQICENAGKTIRLEKPSLFDRFENLLHGKREDLISENEIEQMSRFFNYGYNVKTYSVENMMSSKIIDPVKVTRVALQNASSIAGLLLTTECVIVDEDAYRPTHLYNE
jgi:chaperonin GroEL